MAPSEQRTAASPPAVEVTAGVLRDADGRVLLARRATGRRQGGRWELPGGKREADETPEACLARELREELGVMAEIGPRVAVVEHDDGDGAIALMAYEIARWSGVPVAREGVHEALAWSRPEDLLRFDLAPADVPIAETLARTAAAAIASVRRLEASPLELIRQTAGGPAEITRKVIGLIQALSGWVDGRLLDERLARLTARGLVDEAPSRAQLVAGSVDMLRFWITPAAADYYADKGIHFGFHQLLRILDDPRSMVDPVGLMSERDTIIGHLLQVVHANPCYDLQLLEMIPDGLDELESQAEAMIAGTHPRAASIGAIVEDPGYHERLLAYVRRYRVDREAAPPIRDNVASSPRFEAVERTFGTLPAAMRYFRRLPRTWLGAGRHLLAVRSFPEALAEPLPPSPDGASARVG